MYVYYTEAVVFTFDNVRTLLNIKYIIDIPQKKTFDSLPLWRQKFDDRNEGWTLSMFFHFLTLQKSFSTFYRNYFQKYFLQETEGQIACASWSVARAISRRNGRSRKCNHQSPITINNHNHQSPITLTKHQSQILIITTIIIFRSLKCKDKKLQRRLSPGIQHLVYESLPCLVP